MKRLVAGFLALCAVAFAQTPSRVTIANYAGYNALAPVAPGSLASAYGTFGNVTLTAVPGNQLNPMPRTLAGIVVRVAGTDAPLYFVSSGQINFVVPVGTPTGAQTVEVLSGGTVIARGPINVYDVGPALATINQDAARPGLIVNADGSLNLTTPIARGGIVLVFATGCGATSPASPDGAPPTATANVAARVRAFVSVHEAEVVGAAASGQFPGICQVNIRVPNQPIVSGTVPLFLTVNGIASNPVTLRVQQ